LNIRANVFLGGGGGGVRRYDFFVSEILGLRKCGSHQNSTPPSAISTRYRAGPNQIARRSYHTKCTKKCGLRTNCNAVLKELDPKNLNWIYGRSSHITKWHGGQYCVFVCVKSAMLCHLFVGPASPTPTPMCPSRDFGRKYFGAGPVAQNPRFQGAAERGGGPNRRTNPNKRFPRHKPMGISPPRAN
jgi:hypothetical protein